MPALSVHAVGLGEIVPRSSLGEPFAMRIPVQLNAGEEFSAGCVNILPGPDAGAPLPPGLRASMEIVSGRHYLAIRNSRPTNDPVVGLRLEFTCNDLQSRDYVVFLNPATEEAPALQAAAPEPVARMQSGGEQVAVRPRRPRTAANAQRTKRAEQSKANESPSLQVAQPKANESPSVQMAQPKANESPSLQVAQPKANESPSVKMAQPKANESPSLQVAQPKASESPSLGSVLPLRPDVGPLDVSEADREKLRAAMVENVGFDEAMAKANQRTRNLETEVLVLRKELELTRQATVEKPAAASNGWDTATLVVTIGKSLLYGVPTLFALAGLIAWMPGRRRDQPSEADPWEKQAEAVRERVKNATPADPIPAAAADAPAPERTSRPTFREWQARQQARAPQPAPGLDLTATLPEEIAPIEFEKVSQSDLEAPVTLDIEFSLPEDQFPLAAQEAYFAGRFGGSSEDVSILHDLDTVIEQARSILEDDKDPVKAADLLELATALHPGEVRSWLALFGIYRRASMARQYAVLGEKFRNAFADDPNWPTVQRLGREIDAANALYEPAVPVESGEGAGPEESSQDVTDRWLDVPLDFTSVLLADELRDALTNDAPSAAQAASGG